MTDKSKIYNYLAGGSLLGSILILAVFFKAPDLSFEGLSENIPKTNLTNETSITNDPEVLLETANADLEAIEFEADNLLADLLEDLER